MAPQQQWQQARALGRLKLGLQRWPQPLMRRPCLETLCHQWHA